MTRPPSGSPPPTTARFAGETIALTPLAEAVAERYFAEFPGDVERYGDAARAWEVHDTLYCLNWALLDVKGYTSLEEQVLWLAGILRARDFPVEQLARNLELAADEMPVAEAAQRLRAAALSVRRG
jgi:hypothetical protein